MSQKARRQATPEAGEVPDMIRSRLLSLRMFSAADMIVDGDVFDGAELGERLTRAFDNKDVAYAHIHFAKHGCFAGKATRA